MPQLIAVPLLLFGAGAALLFSLAPRPLKPRSRSEGS